MKKLLGLLLFSIFFSSCMSAPAILPPDQLIIRRVIEVQKPKEELYSISMNWMAKTFKSAKAVIEYQDKEEGKIIGKGMMVVKYGLGIPADTFFTLTIETKDNKLRISVENSYMVMTSSGHRVESLIDNEFTMNQCLKPEIERMFDSLDVALKSQNDNW